MIEATKDLKRGDAPGGQGCSLCDVREEGDAEHEHSEEGQRDQSTRKERRSASEQILVQEEIPIAMRASHQIAADVRAMPPLLRLTTLVRLARRPVTQQCRARRPQRPSQPFLSFVLKWTRSDS
jgi:hypothetical protein